MDLEECPCREFDDRLKSACRLLADYINLHNKPILLQGGDALVPNPWKRMHFVPLAVQLRSTGSVHTTLNPL